MGVRRHQDVRYAAKLRKETPDISWEDYFALARAFPGRGDKQRKR